MVSLLVAGSQALAGDRYEPDNSRSAAGNIASGERQTHSIDPAGDLDWVKFTPPSLGKYNVTFVSGSTRSWLKGEVWLKQGLLPEIKVATFTVPSGNSYIPLNFTTGAKYVKVGVWAQKTTTRGSYTIGVVKL
jgi:hypothetical protein